MEEYLGEESTQDEAMEEITQTIYDNSLPLFRRMIESGNVRLAILDHSKVSINRDLWTILASCSPEILIDFANIVPPVQFNGVQEFWKPVTSIRESMVLGGRIH
jgi:hypothetical protein